MVGVSTGDRCASNVAAVAQSRRLVLEGPEQVLHHEGCCLLHAMNNLKVASGPLCRLTAKPHSFSCVMKANWPALIEEKVKRHAFESAPEDIKRGNVAKLDALFDLHSPHHLRPRGGDQAKVSNFILGLQQLLGLDNGDLSSADVHHYCLQPDGTTCCRSLQEMKDKMLSCWIRLYVGSAWPVPAVTRLTYTQIVAKSRPFLHAP